MIAYLLAWLAASFMVAAFFCALFAGAGPRED